MPSILALRYQKSYFFVKFFTKSVILGLMNCNSPRGFIRVSMVFLTRIENSEIQERFLSHLRSVDSASFAHWKSPFEPPHDKTNKMTFAASEDSDQISPVWSVFAVCMKKHWVHRYLLSTQWRLIMRRLICHKRLSDLFYFIKFIHITVIHVHV